MIIVIIKLVNFLGFCQGNEKSRLVAVTSYMRDRATDTTQISSMEKIS